MRKTILRLLIGAGAVFALARSGVAQPVEVGHGQLPFEYLGRKLVPIHRHDDSLFVIVVDQWNGAGVFLNSEFHDWDLLAGVWGPDFEQAEFKLSRTGLLLIYSQWLDSSYFYNGFEFEARPSPARPIVDSHGNFHIFSENSIYYYSTDTLASFGTVDTVSLSAEFVYLVSSPDDSIVAALFHDAQTDSLYKYVAYQGQPIDFTAPSEVISGAIGISSAFDIALDYSGNVVYVVNQDFDDCPPWAWGCHYAWSEDFGFKYLDWSSDDALDGTNFELTFGTAAGEMIAVSSTGPPWGIGTKFFAATDHGASWYSCTYYVSGFYVYYGSTPRTYMDTLDFTYFTNEDIVYYRSIPRDSIFAHLVSVEGEEIALPANIRLSNYPNPFNSRTTISFNLPAKADIALKVYDVTGGIIATLYKGPAEAGPHSIIWDGTGGAGQAVSSGVYFYRLSIDGDRSVTKRMLLIK